MSTSSRVNIKEGKQWQRETREIRIKETTNNPAARAKRVVSRQVAEAVAAAKAADNVVAVAARAINASQSHSIKQKG